MDGGAHAAHLELLSVSRDGPPRSGIKAAAYTAVQRALLSDLPSRSELAEALAHLGSPFLTPKHSYQPLSSRVTLRACIVDAGEDLMSRSTDTFPWNCEPL